MFEHDWSTASRAFSFSGQLGYMWSSLSAQVYVYLELHGNNRRNVILRPTFMSVVCALNVHTRFTCTDKTNSPQRQQTNKLLRRID